MEVSVGAVTPMAPSASLRLLPNVVPLATPTYAKHVVEGILSFLSPLLPFYIFFISIFILMYFIFDDV